MKEIRDENDIVFCLHELIERATAKKPEQKYLKSLPNCPNCGEPYLQQENEYGNVVANYNFCPECGQEVTCILPLHSVDVTDVEVSPETVCQYIGLTNKNGRKIFEGDIVKHDMTDTVGTVKWYQEDYVGWCVDDVQIGEQQFTYEMWGECEIIGSIFDNVDLLKE